MAKLLDIVEGWTDELGPFTLLADGSAVDLTGMTEELILRDKNGSLVTVIGSTRIDATPSTGKVYYKPAATDLSNSLSPYSLHWKITDGAGDVVFFPNGAPHTITVYRP